MNIFGSHKLIANRQVEKHHRVMLKWISAQCDEIANTQYALQYLV